MNREINRKKREAGIAIAIGRPKKEKARQSTRRLKKNLPNSSGPGKMDTSTSNPDTWDPENHAADGEIQVARSEPESDGEPVGPATRRVST